MYSDGIKKILSKAERRLFQKLDSPSEVQKFLNKLPINFEPNGETYMSPRRVVHERTAHCFEGALFAAATLAYHGEKPLILDLKTVRHDEDHVVALFKRNGAWGAISKTNHAVLRYRDPIYKTLRELVLSYFHEYILDGKKTLRSFSKPFDLTRYAPQRWISTEEDLVWLVDALDDSPHEELLTRSHIRSLRAATKFEIDTMAVTEWKKPR